MLEWPTVCTHEIGHTNLVNLCIITTDEITVRKRAYKVSIDKQQFINTEIIILLSYLGLHLSWSFQRRMVDQDCVLITGV